jgi:hypothetical protein
MENHGKPLRIVLLDAIVAGRPMTHGLPLKCLDPGRAAERQPGAADSQHRY